MQSAAIYAHVSTKYQDVQRQLDECREHIDSNFPDIKDVDVYADIISGADEDGELAKTWREINMMDLLVQSGVSPEDLFCTEMPPDD